VVYVLRMQSLRAVVTSASMLALLLVSGGCDPTERSDEGQYVLSIGLAQPLGSHSHRVLVGSTFPLTVHSAVEDDVLDEEALACVTRSGSGVVVDVGDGMFEVETVGAGAVELAEPSLACPSNGDVADFGPDRWSVTGTDAADVVGRWAHGSDAAILDYGFSPGPLGEFPDIIGQPIANLRVVGDASFRATPALVTDADEREVRWADPEAQLQVPEHYAELLAEDDEAVEPMLEGMLHPGESFTASVSILGTTFPLPPVQAVAAEAVQSLELVPVYNPGDEQREWGPPAGVLAITRDGEGRRIVDAPVDFELSAGYLSFTSERDTLYLGDVCRNEPKGPTGRTATVAATLGELDASVDLEWVALPGDEHDGDADCTRSCACTTSSPGQSTPALLALLGLGLWLRRKR
jgi:MYXO-CTERM domain-containing protein